MVRCQSTLVSHSLNFASVHNRDLIEGLVMSYTIDKIEIHTWLEAMRRQPLSRLQQYKITHVEHRKSSRGFAHEYLIIAFHNPDPFQRYKRYAKLERGVKHNDSFSNSTPSLLTSGAAVDPCDIISISHSRESFHAANSYSVFVMDFSNPISLVAPPTIADLAAVLIAVQRMAPMYELYNHMCYWFARAVFEGLAFLCDGRIEDGERPWARGRFLRIFRVSGTAVAPEGRDKMKEGKTKGRSKNKMIPSHVQAFRDCLRQCQRDFAGELRWT